MNEQEVRDLLESIAVSMDNTAEMVEGSDPVLHLMVSLQWRRAASVVRMMSDEFLLNRKSLQEGSQFDVE